MLNNEKYDLFPHWLVVGFVLTTLLAYVFICHWHGHGFRQPVPENQRIVFRSVFYILAIISFPITNLIRHIQIRLNQSVRGDKPAKSRYLLTVIVSMAMIESIGLMGFVMFMLGDAFNTLYIFVGLSALGAFLYRPKESEYETIVNSLSANREES